MLSQKKEEVWREPLGEDPENSNVICSEGVAPGKNGKLLNTNKEKRRSSQKNFD